MLAEKANIEKNIKWHSLRHSSASFLLQEEVDMKQIQLRLGHSNISTTFDIYAHVGENMQKKATEKISNVLYKK